jgi:hypothetical protein
MKLSARLETLKQQKRAEGADAGKDKRTTPWFGASTWVLLGLGLALGGVGDLAVRDFLIKIPPELVGFWEIQEGPQKDGTFEFFRNGTLEVRLPAKKKDILHKTQVSVHDKTLVMTTKDPISREETKNEGVIRELTANTLILELEKGDVLKMVRIE